MENSNDTKREVLKQALRYVPVGKEYDALQDGPAGDLYDKFLESYDSALPDDLPVIPGTVSDVIVKLKHKEFSLSGAMSYAAVTSLSPWMTFEHEETFALAWVLGVWKVKETDEVVKL